MAFTAPVLTYRDAENPANIISVLSFVQSTLGSDFLPVLQGENSTIKKFRIYNNYGLSSSIANAFNIFITVYDGAGTGSHTAGGSVAAQSWIRIYETGFGESTGAPGLYTAWMGSDTAIGGSNYYYPQVGSDGTFSGQIRAGTGNSGLGFIEFATYAQLPSTVESRQWTFAISLDYEWAD